MGVISPDVTIGYASLAANELGPNKLVAADRPQDSEFRRSETGTLTSSGLWCAMPIAIEFVSEVLEGAAIRFTSNELGKTGPLFSALAACNRIPPTHF